MSRFGTHGVEQLESRNLMSATPAAPLPTAALVGPVLTITGTGEADAAGICNNLGSDANRGAGGNDILVGGGGDDFLFGGSGDDILLGGAGDDYLNGGTGSNIIISDEGVNHIKAQSDADIVICNMS